jgi:hypothetical protein
VLKSPASALPLASAAAVRSSSSASANGTTWLPFTRESTAALGDPASVLQAEATFAALLRAARAPDAVHTASEALACLAQQLAGRALAPDVAAAVLPPLQELLVTCEGALASFTNVPRSQAGAYAAQMTDYVHEAHRAAAVRLAEVAARGGSFSCALVATLQGFTAQQQAYLRESRQMLQLLPEEQLAVVGNVTVAYTVEALQLMVRYVARAMVAKQGVQLVLQPVAAGPIGEPCLPGRLPACLPACLLACMHACLADCLLACMHAFLHVCAPCLGNHRAQKCTVAWWQVARCRCLAPVLTCQCAVWPAGSACSGWRGAATDLCACRLRCTGG